jgi:hypothetical protein
MIQKSALAKHNLATIKFQYQNLKVRLLEHLRGSNALESCDVGEAESSCLYQWLLLAQKTELAGHPSLLALQRLHHQVHHEMLEILRLTGGGYYHQANARYAALRSRMDEFYQRMDEVSRLVRE